ncbi:hypothetical protein ACLN6N_02995 [Sphingomonas carotinifaciens]|uniref:hypothetical protein n=1 Tax=Sphingomonas carotinifaciens TaxID=1166323 RepID=UPI0039A3D316
MRVTREIGGKTYVADFAVEKGVVILSSEFGQKKAQLGSLPAEQLAGMLLAEQVSAHFMASKPVGN